MTSLLAFFCLSFTAMRCRPPLCGQIPLIFCELFFQGSDHLFWGPLPYFTQIHFFACAGLARSLREKCNLISQFWSCWIDIFWNRCSLKTNSISNEKLWWQSLYTYNVWECIYIYILYVNDIYHDSTWKHLRQPCANLAPSLCFAGFPCMTPRNELVKPYKSVGCVPPRLKFLFRTFDRLSHIKYIHRHGHSRWHVHVHVWPVPTQATSYI